MEHNLGLTCDPVGELVQIPCIERNALGAVKAVNAARLALHSEERPKVSLDQVIETMRKADASTQRVNSDHSRPSVSEHRGCQGQPRQLDKRRSTDTL